jgi:two-component system CheB/CheR fusion protein
MAAGLWRPHSPQVSTDRSSPESGAKRVLIVDDNADARETLSVLVGAAGHRVMVASDGDTALELAAKFRPDVVLMDIGLPDMDGFEVARRLRLALGEPAPAFVALSGYSQQEHFDRAHQSGFLRYFVKPVDIAQLRAFLAEHEK